MKNIGIVTARYRRWYVEDIENLVRQVISYEERCRARLRSERQAASVKSDAEKGGNYLHLVVNLPPNKEQK